jgi:3-hydroxyisobutyrate dehydrogenase-like beta-hydroxyacid dehydrogenase
MRVGFIGLGNMGLPQATEIANGGFDLALYDASPGPLEAFRGRARLATSPAAVAQETELICICVRDEAQLREVIEGPQGILASLRPNALVLVHSTVSPATIIAMSVAAAARGAQLIDAAVTRTRFGAAQGPFVLTMTGGEPALTERARPVLGTFSTQVVHAGPLGAGMALKITNNFVTWVHVLAIQQAYSLAKAGGVEIDKLREVMTGNGNLTPVTRAVIDGLVRDAGMMSAERAAFAESQGRIGEKDLELALECARAGKVELTIASHVRDGILKSMLGG